MADERVKRKISAILSADVLGYCKPTVAGEVVTVQKMESYRKTASSLIEGPAITDRTTEHRLNRRWR